MCRLASAIGVIFSLAKYGRSRPCQNSAENYGELQRTLVSTHGPALGEWALNALALLAKPLVLALVIVAAGGCVRPASSPAGLENVFLVCSWERLQPLP